MKVTFHTGILFDGLPDTAISCDVELPDDYLPSDVARELESWVKCVTFASYDIHVDVLPETPDRELHPVH